MTYRTGSFYDSLETRVAAIEGMNMGDLEGRLEALEEADLISRCGTLETNLSAITGRMSTAESDIDALESLTASHTSALSGYGSRITALENWKALMPKRVDVYTGTTDANGDITISFPGGRYAAAPKISLGFIFNNDNYGSFYNIKALSTTGVTLRVMRNKNSAVLLGGNIDPDEPLASTAVSITAFEF